MKLLSENLITLENDHNPRSLTSFPRVMNIINIPLDLDMTVLLFPNTGRVKAGALHFKASLPLQVRVQFYQDQTDYSKAEFLHRD